MKTTAILITLIINTTSLFSQNSKDFDLKFKNANAFYKLENVYEALPIFLDLYKTDTSNANINYLVGECYLKGRLGRAKSLPYLEKAILSVSPHYKSESASERNVPIVAYKYLGDAYHLHSKYDKAILAYQSFQHELIKFKKKDDVNYKDAERQIEMCNTAIELIATPVNVTIENMGKNVNTLFADYSPVLTADQNTMIFTSRRNETTGNERYDSGKFFEDIFISYKTGSTWSVAKNIGAPINTDGNEASVGMSPDGQEILIYKDDNGDGNIYHTTLNGDKWSVPVKLNSNINSKYWEPSAFISADGQSIYFTSNRPGGFGGRDIYMSKKTDKGDWGPATNLGETINTAFDEDAPFIHPDGVTLYFSSNGHKTMGGFDIFYSSLAYEGTKWLNPVNVGYPVNSPNDDIFYVVSPDKTKAYYSSFKEGGFGEKDNYMITFINSELAPLTLLKGIVEDNTGLVPQGVNITVTDNETGIVVGTYKPNSNTGQYVFILTPGKNYNISYEAEGFLFYSENRQIEIKTNYYEIYKAIQLPPVTVGSKIVLNNIFFDFAKSTLRKTSNVELNNILKLLNKYPKIDIEISGYTDSKGTAEYNLKLSQERAEALITYLTLKGINKERMIAKGYGETMPDASNKNFDGSDSPEGRQLNRRDELKIIKIN